MYIKSYLNKLNVWITKSIRYECKAINLINLIYECAYTYV